MRCVLVHSAIADARMWEPIIPWFQGHEPISYDLRGHGQTDDADGDFHHVDDLLELLGDEPAVLVGSSMGGRIALEAALLRPDLVLGLVLLCPGVSGWSDWTPETEAYDAEETRLLDAGEVDRATLLSVDFWVVGPGRTRDDVPLDVLELVAAMQARAFAVQLALGVEESPRVADVVARLGEVSCPTLVVVGEHDIPEMHAIARAVAAAVPGAQHALVERAAHLPSLERPGDTGPLIERFLADLA